jgi:hypothetical protein
MAVVYPRRPSASARSTATGRAGFVIMPAQPAPAVLREQQVRDSQRLDAKHDSPILRGRGALRFIRQSH